MSYVVPEMYRAMGSGNEPETKLTGENVELDDEDCTDGVYSLRINYWGDDPNVPLIRVEAVSEERAVSAYEAVRAALAGCELFPGSTVEKEESDE